MPSFECLYVFENVIYYLIRVGAVVFIIFYFMNYERRKKCMLGEYSDIRKKQSIKWNDSIYSGHFTAT